MALQKLTDFYPNYRQVSDKHDVTGISVYTDSKDEKIGTVNDVLVDREGRFRYLLVELGFWIFGKKVLLPVGAARIDYNQQCAYTHMTKEQAENLPEFNENMDTDFDYEERVRNIYRTPTSGQVYSPLEESSPLETSASLESSAHARPFAANSDPCTTPNPNTYDPDTYDRDRLGTHDPNSQNTYDQGLDNYDRDPQNVYDQDIQDPRDRDLQNVYDQAPNTYDRTQSYDRDTYRYQQEPSLFDIGAQNHQSLRLYEERLIADKNRVKSGEVAVGKHTTTETSQVSVPVDKERVVIERNPPTNANSVPTSESAFREGEVIRMELHEERPEVHKEAFVREEVNIRKEVEHDTIDVQDTVRREELDIDSDGNSVVDQSR
jgi:uncharacterized protein (TIGR02271 family)